MRHSSARHSAQALQSQVRHRAAAISVRPHAATTLVVNNDAISDRFEFEPARMRTAFRFMAGDFEFKPSALHFRNRGVGFRHLTHLTGRFLISNGVVASVDA